MTLDVLFGGRHYGSLRSPDGVLPSTPHYGPLRSPGSVLPSLQTPAGQFLMNDGRATAVTCIKLDVHGASKLPKWWESNFGGFGHEWRF